MDKMKHPQVLTSKQQQWLRHLQDCQAQGQCKTAYGRAHGIKPKRLYQWQWLLKQKGYLGAAPVKRKQTQSAWLPVVIKQPFQAKSRCQIRLPNGIELEWDHDYAVESLIQIVTGVSRP
jgi:hypothetical protein